MSSASDEAGEAVPRAEICFLPNVADLVAAQRLYQLAGIRRFAAIMAIAAAASGFLLWASDDLLDVHMMGTTLAALFVIIFLIPLLSRYWTIPRMAKRALAQDRTLAEPCTFRWDSRVAGMESGSGNWNYPLADLVCWMADKQVLLLFRQTHLFHFIPLRAFPDAQSRQSLFDALAANGVSNKWPPK